MWFDIHKANIRKLVVSWRMLSVYSRGYISTTSHFYRESIDILCKHNKNLLCTHNKKFSCKGRKFRAGVMVSKPILIALGVI